MKKIFVFMIIYMFVFIIDSNSIDISMFTLYAESSDYESHIKNIFSIHKSGELLKSNKKIIDLLFNELKYDGVNYRLDNAPENGYITLQEEAVHALGVVGDSKAADRLLKILNDTDEKIIKEAIISALAKVGDNENYNVSLGIIKYFKNISLSKISKDEDFCFKSVQCFYELSQNKPADIIEYIGLTDMFKIFSNKKIFTDDVVEYTKRKFLNVMLSNV